MKIPHWGLWFLVSAEAFLVLRFQGTINSHLQASVATCPGAVLRVCWQLPASRKVGGTALDHLLENLVLLFQPLDPKEVHVVQNTDLESHFVYYVRYLKSYWPFD